ncbi:transporter [Gorillibacterium sp. CAU 1737]|uniref:transporter n=1 Tax=Gorillibacterium sp. CAU 1737 TaxID=3140362 RepID=UPI003260DEC7
MPPQGPQGLQQGPTSPPPSYVPQQPMATSFAVDPGAIWRCRFRYTYIWLRNGSNFWFFPTFVGRTSVSGFRWTGRSWVFTGLSLNQIVTFTCV